MRSCRVLAGLAGLVLIVFWLATVAGVSGQLLNLVFTVMVVLVLPAAVWSVCCAPAELRRFAALVVSALSLQVVGSLLWYVAYAQDAGRMPANVGYWTPVFYVSLLLALAAVWTGVRDILRPCEGRLLRNVCLDYSIVVIAAASVAILTTEHHGTQRIGTLGSLGAIARPLLCLLVVVLLASAVLGRWQSLPLPVGLAGFALLCDACGELLAAYSVAHGGSRNDPGTNLVWFTALVFALFAALAVIAGVERPVRFARRPLPGVSATPLVVVVLAAWSVAGAVAVYGTVNSDQRALFAGVIAIGWTGIAGLFRMVGALSEARTAYARLDEAVFGLEQERERAEGLLVERERAIAQLQQRNVELTAVHSMLGPLLDMANERTDGALAAHLEEAADELAAWLPLRRPDTGGC